MTVDDSDKTDIAELPLEAARFVTGATGGPLLQEIAALPGDLPAHVLTLRKRGLPSAIAALLAEVAHARKRARARFGADAAHLFFTGEALAQATSPGIAAYHARGLARLGTVADLGCGVGMDSIAFARAGADVIAVEQDAARLHFARANATALGVSDKITFICGDVQTADWEADTAFCDPSRRTAQIGSTKMRRVSANAEHYAPPLPFIVDLMASRVKRGGCVKLSPALPDAVLNEIGGRIEFLSETRECKEACIWFGDAHGAAQNASRAAVIVPADEVVLPDDFAVPIAPSSRAFVYDPDPALIRANALGSLVARIGDSAGLASADDCYLAGDTPAPSQLAQTFRVLYETVYSPRTLRVWLRQNEVRRVVVKKRHFKQEPPEILRDLGLPLSGGAGKEVVLILARHGKTFTAFVCEPYAG